MAFIDTAPITTLARRLLSGIRARLSLRRTVALVFLAAMLGLRVWDPILVEMLRLRSFDLLQRINPYESDSRPVVIVDIDEASLDKLGQWPWSRSLLGQLLIELQQRGAVVVGFDIVFAERDRLSPGALADLIEQLDEDIRRRLDQLPNNDLLFARIIERGRVVTGRFGLSSIQPGADRELIRETSIAFVGGPPQPYLYSLAGVVQNIPEIDLAAAGAGMLSIIPEPDGIVRRVPALLRWDDRVMPALSIEMLRVATGRPTIATKVDEAGVKSVVVAGVEIPLDRQGRMWVRASHHDPARYVPAHEVLAGTVDRSAIEGKLVLVGVSAAGLLDIKATPLEAAMPGVEVHAQLLETILAQANLVRPNYAIGMELSTAVVVGILLIVFVPMLGARWTLGVLLLVSVALLGLVYYSFTDQRLLIDPSFPLATAAALYALLVYSGYLSEERQRRYIRQTFGQYLSPALVSQLANDPSKVRLGGVTREMTFMFSDVRGFTSISENFQDDPQGLTELINRFLTPMTNAVLRHSGTVDKYMGDCIMAFWNAPLDDPRHASHACQAALDMHRALDELNAELRQEAADDPTRDDHTDYRLAKRYSLGIDGESDAVKAFELFKREAEQGFANAQYSLGKAYRDGAGVAVDQVAAATWFLAAAEQGHAKAQRHIGTRLARGAGVERDDVQALMWLTLAGQSGLAAADEGRKGLVRNMTTAQVTEAEQWARLWRPRVSGARTIKLETGVGLNTGPCVVGNMGSEQRFDYSVLGDAVNLAARLEGQSKNYGVGIVISEDTRKQAPEFAAIELDLIAVKGKREAVRIYGLVGDAAAAAEEGYRALIGNHAAMLAAYRAQRWDEARALLTACQEIDDRYDDLYELYRGRIAQYEADPPGPDWDGVFVAQTK